MSLSTLLLRTSLTFATAVLPLSSARSELALSQLIVELDPASHSREDVELWNTGGERSYVAIDPAEIVNAGLTGETRKQEGDPEQLGLLVSPSRAILEPGQHKNLRIAAIAAPSDKERVYRVTVKPVVGRVEADTSGLKLLVGYDVLVLVRPLHHRDNLVAWRTETTLTIENRGNASVELLNGKQCDNSGQRCRTLPGKRLYAGASWSIQAGAEGQVEYAVRTANGLVRKAF